LKSDLCVHRKFFNLSSGCSGDFYPFRRCISRSNPSSCALNAILQNFYGNHLHKNRLRLDVISYKLCKIISINYVSATHVSTRLIGQLKLSNIFFIFVRAYRLKVQNFNGNLTVRNFFSNLECQINSPFIIIKLSWLKVYLPALSGLFCY